uniref:G-patch domain-containing protein n=1 Tax=Chenopodium quinoa TaxID=63459 RepID=A0A803MZD9_CHEQI
MQKVKLVPCKGSDVICNKDPFSNVYATMGYNGTFCLIDDEEDALTLLSIAEKNFGAHLSTTSNFQCPIYLYDLSDDEHLHVAHLTRAGRHFKPSYLKDENPVEALRRKEKDRELVEVNNEEDDAIKRMKEVNANVSIWKLPTHSQPHRAAVLRHINETLVGNPEVMNVSSIGKLVLHLDEEEGSQLDGFTIHNIGFDSIGSWKEEEETEEDPEEDLEEDEETEEDSEEETEEDPEEELQENDNDFEGHDEGSRKRSRAKEFDFDFDTLCYRRRAFPHVVQQKSGWTCIILIDNEKMKLVNMEQSDRESFSHLFSRCSYIRAQLRFPIIEREFMLILLRKLNDFYYRHMVSIKYADLSHMERHGYEIDAYRLQERRPKVHPQGERVNRRIFTRIDEPLSVVHDRLSKKGVLCQPMTNQTRKSTLHLDSIQEIQDPIPQTITRGLQLMLKMGYVPGAGLGRNGEGMRHPIPIIDKRNRHGLGFYEKMVTKVMKRKSLTLNGQFLLQNDTEPFYEFPEPWYDLDKEKILPGLEIFFAEAKNEEFIKKWFDKKSVFKKDFDWADHL